ncbi:hypothetical protein [Xanthomonas albilineans]|uniref:hypothetical protein n=1 Tax=Xanthomonas albilineans TaxID=29447 RepID=UPI0005F3084A|nr:hypothetical protein [Xanthomonas albilineans]
MRTLDIIEIDMVAGGTRKSMGTHPLSSSIHHAKAHNKTHHAKAKTHHHHQMALHKSAASHITSTSALDAQLDSEIDEGGGEGGEGGEGADGAQDTSGAGTSDKPGTSASVIKTIRGPTVTYTAADGSTNEIWGAHPTRDNNPLNIRSGTFADNHGSIGNDGGFAIFSNPQAGRDAAMANMNRLNNNMGGNATLSQLITTWSPPGENNTSQMITDITNGSGLNPSDHWGTLNSDQQNAFINAYGKREGWKPITH